MEGIKKLLLITLILLIPALADAQPISMQEALAKAQSFFCKASQAMASKGKGTHKTPEMILATNRDEFYVFNNVSDGGYVVISGDERMPEVLAYSFDGSYDTLNLPCNMQAWMDDYAAQVAYLQSHPEARVIRSNASERRDIEPLLTCWFGQGKYYSDKCPVVNGQHCVTGCVATSMAQIMHYWQWPMKTTDVIPAYKTNTMGINMPAQPITNIDWTNMLNQYNSWEEYSQEQIDAIATLMLLCGTSVQMDYTLNVSAAGGPVAALQQYFGYDELIDVADRKSYNSEEWEQMIYEELDLERPVLYGGGNANGEGHGFVLDGFHDGYFHANWGWGGVYSWVLMTEVEGWNGFVLNHSATIGVQPSSPDFPSKYSVLDNGILTLCYDKEKANRTGMILKKSEWRNHADEITTCVIDPSFATLKLKDMTALFEGLTGLETIEGIENLNTDMTSNMAYMFNRCSNLKTLDVSGFKTGKVTSMWAMFADCSSLTHLDVSGFNTENVEYLAYMFKGCTGLTSLDVSGFKTDRATDIGAMFNGCSKLTVLDLSSFNTDQVISMWGMFSDCQQLSTIYASEQWNMSSVETTDYMFFGCPSLVGGAGTTFNWSHTNGEYARIDGGPSQPGYFTYKENTGIADIHSTSDFIGVYSPSGRQLSKPQKGLNIIRMRDGETKKMMLP